MYSLLTNVYPKIEWIPWKFIGPGALRKFWQERENQKKFVEWFERQENIEDEDWYIVPISVKNNKKFHVLSFKS